MAGAAVVCAFWLIGRESPPHGIPPEPVRERARLTKVPTGMSRRTIFFALSRELIPRENSRRRHIAQAAVRAASAANSYLIEKF
jgi:hypothetical protein